MVGFWSNPVPAVMAGTGPVTIFALGVPLAEAVSVGEEDAAESLVLLLLPQPAAVSMSAGTASSTERRRTGFLVRVVGCGAGVT
jgi:hypothetical protein